MFLVNVSFELIRFLLMENHVKKYVDLEGNVSFCKKSLITPISLLESSEIIFFHFLLQLHTHTIIMIYYTSKLF